jgi:hypothetical protein
VEFFQVRMKRSNYYLRVSLYLLQLAAAIDAASPPNTAPHSSVEIKFADQLGTVYHLALHRFPFPSLLPNRLISPCPCFIQD